MNLVERSHGVSVDLDSRGRGGAPTVYQHDQTRLWFQTGPCGAGLTNEALLVIVADRLKAFQAGEFACHWNAMALAAIEGALSFLEERTTESASRS